MLSVWTKHLEKDPKAKAKFEDYLKSNKELFNRLEQILNEIEAGLHFTELSVDTFKDPNWAYLQAYKNGFRAMLHKMRIIINMEVKGE